MKTLDFRRAAVALLFVALLAAAGGAFAAPLTMTGDVDTDFLGKPGVIIKQGTSLVPPYTLSDPPLSPVRADQTQMIQGGAVIPTGFHVSRTAVYYDCKNDTLYVGLDVSNPTLDPNGNWVDINGNPVAADSPNAVMSRAWDADGDGNPCRVCNPMLINPTPNCAIGQQGVLDPQLLGNGSQDIPLRNNSPLGEKYLLFFDFNRDGVNDATFLVYDDGTPVDALPTHKHYGNPCAENPTVHAQLSSNGTPIVVNPPAGIDFDVIYRTASDSDYGTHRDIEFKIIGVSKIPLSTTGTPASTINYCDMNLKTNADTDYDTSPEVSLNWGRFNFVAAANLQLACKKLVNKPTLCTLPDTVTYTLQATNNSPDTTTNITIADPSLVGGPWTFQNVAPGQTVTVTPAPTKTFGVEFCGSNPFVNTMTVTAIPVDCCATGSATASCQATVSAPPSANVQVSCSKTVDKTKLCTLPDTVTYTLKATNISTTNTPVTIKIVDAALGISQTFSNVAKGATVTVTPSPTKTFDNTFCGANPFVNTMTVTATAEGCACGTLTATSSCAATVTPPDQARVKVSCTKAVDKPALCSLPDTVTYTLTAKNDSDTATAVTLIVADTQLGVSKTFTGVAKGDTRSFTVQKTFGVDFCGSNPFINTMTVTATAEGCACGTVTATSSCSATVSSPPVTRVRVTCSKVADIPNLCKLPQLVTYTLTATNNSISETPVTLIIKDAQLGVNQTYTAVAKGASRSFSVTKTFGADFCGSNPFVNTMTVTATAEGCACGTVTATSSCQATVTPPPTANVQVSCSKTVDKTKLCTLPDTVTYTLKATNISTTNTPVTIKIVDAALGISQTFSNVAKGATVTVTPSPTKTFDNTFCGANPFVNTMTVTATAEGCACGTLTATSSCAATVTPPDQARVKVSCTKTADKTKLCTLPDTVTYTLTATNNSDTNTPVTIKIVDAALGINKTFTGVAKGASVTVTPAPTKTFDNTFCGANPFVNTMTVTASAEGCACGTVTATSSCAATVTPPDQARVKVTCSKTPDKTSVCTLPDTVTYTLRATNASDTNTPVTIRIVDPLLQVDQTFTNVAKGQTVTVTPAPTKTFDASFCGANPFVNTMTVTASAEAVCVCGTTSATSSCSATVTMPVVSSIACEATIDGGPVVVLQKAELPKTLNCGFTTCNRGASSLDCVVSLSDLPPGWTPGIAPGPDGKWHFTVKAGECYTIPGTITLTTDMVPCPGQIQWKPTMTIESAIPSPGECACAAVLPIPCSVQIGLRCPGLSQAYPAFSIGDLSFRGYDGRGGDVISAIGGIFTFIPGDRWSNFVGAANASSPGGLWPAGYTIKNVILKKTTPPFIQCNEVYAPITITQQGSVNIRTWWPLMYEAPGTVWTLSILYGTAQIRTGPNPTDVQNYDDDGPNGPNLPAPVHLDTWEWKVEADLDSLRRVLILFHEIPFGMDEVPLISDEALYLVLLDKIAAIEALVEANDTTGASLLLGDFELEVQDACIGSSPTQPYPGGVETGIAQTNENPACCKLLIDVEYIAGKLGLFLTNK